MFYATAGASLWPVRDDWREPMPAEYVSTLRWRRVLRRLIARLLGVGLLGIHDKPCVG
jgi:hypothetical protein